MATKKNMGIGAAVVAAGAATAIAASKKHRKAESKNTGKIKHPKSKLTHSE